MSFYEHVRADVLRHGAINNTYLTRFQAGEVTDREFHEFAVEFYSFARFFPRILAAQLVNTEDEAVADELTKVPLLGTRRRHRQASPRIAVPELPPVDWHRHS
jgi:pyrroloquinoline-quinone synthase